MAILPSTSDRNSDEFAARTSDMQALIELLDERRAKIEVGGSEAACAKHAGRGKLLARERIDRLVDPEGAFLELGTFAAWDHYDNAVPAAGIITGIGVVEGRACEIVVPAFVMNIFEPLIFQPPSTSSACVRGLPASEPASASVRPNAASRLPDTSSGSHSAFYSSSP